VKSEIPEAVQRSEGMLTKFVFIRLSVLWQVNLMKKWGIMLGTRRKGGREVYTYMFRNLFAEVHYENDNDNAPVEKFIVLPGWQNLNEHFEREIKSLR
jgi:hypothetical protein